MSKLELLSLHCKRKQDIIGQDEICVLADGKIIVPTKKFKKGQTIPLQPTFYDFSDSVQVWLTEEDGNSSDQLGNRVTIRDNGSSQSPVEFTTSGAHYELSFKVT